MKVKLRKKVKKTIGANGEIARFEAEASKSIYMWLMVNKKIITTDISSSGLMLDQNLRSRKNCWLV